MTREPAYTAWSSGKTLRVRRGPDWVSGCADGCSGLNGTVVGVASFYNR